MVIRPYLGAFLWPKQKVFHLVLVSLIVRKKIHETYFAWITGKTSWGRGVSRWGSKPWQEAGTCAGEAIWPNRWFYESGRASEEEGGSNLSGMSNLKYILAFCKSIYDTTPWAGTAISIWHMNMCKCWLVSTCRKPSSVSKAVIGYLFSTPHISGLLQVVSQLYIEKESIHFASDVLSLVKLCYWNYIWTQLRQAWLQMDESSISKLNQLELDHQFDGTEAIMKLI